MKDVIQKMLEPYQITTRDDAERALREIIQEIALIGLWRGKFFEHAAFYGGTALRILYGLDRFSEDLDFTLLKPKSFDWSLFEHYVVQELSSYGFKVNFVQKNKSIETEVKSAFLKTNTLHALLQIGINALHSGVHPDAMIHIKVEIDSSPIIGFEDEAVFLRGPMPISVRALTKPSLFAGKIHAALYRAWKHRVKGRDWYDVCWFLRQKIPVNLHYLEQCMRANKQIEPQEHLTGEKVKNILRQRLKEIDLSLAKEDVRPFLRDPSQLEVWSVDFFEQCE